VIPHAGAARQRRVPRHPRREGHRTLAHPRYTPPAGCTELRVRTGRATSPARAWARAARRAIVRARGGPRRAESQRLFHEPVAVDQTRVTRPAAIKTPRLSWALTTNVNRRPSTFSRWHRRAPGATADGCTCGFLQRIPTDVSLDRGTFEHQARRLLRTTQQPEACQYGHVTGLQAMAVSALSRASRRCAVSPGFDWHGGTVKPFDRRPQPAVDRAKREPARADETWCKTLSVPRCATGWRVRGDLRRRSSIVEWRCRRRPRSKSWCPVHRSAAPVIRVVSGRAPPASRIPPIFHPPGSPRGSVGRRGRRSRWRGGTRIVGCASRRSRPKRGADHAADVAQRRPRSNCLTRADHARRTTGRRSRKWRRAIWTAAGGFSCQQRGVWGDDDQVKRCLRVVRGAR